MLYHEELKRAKNAHEVNRKFLNELRQKRPRNLDEQFHKVHDEIFREVDCLQCANCCKTTSPIFTESDITRLARSLRMKTPEFITEYLWKDEDNDFVLKGAPCPFLGLDNKCIVYADRPRACREYPHTNRKRMYQIMPLTLRNTLVCPAVSRIVERLRR